MGLFVTYAFKPSLLLAGGAEGVGCEPFFTLRFLSFLKRFFNSLRIISSSSDESSSLSSTSSKSSNSPYHLNFLWTKKRYLPSFLLNMSLLARNPLLTSLGGASKGGLSAFPFPISQWGPPIAMHRVPMSALCVVAPSSQASGKGLEVGNSDAERDWHKQLQKRCLRKPLY